MCACFCKFLMLLSKFLKWIWVYFVFETVFVMLCRLFLYIHVLCLSYCLYWTNKRVLFGVRTEQYRPCTRPEIWKLSLIVLKSSDLSWKCWKYCVAKNNLLTPHIGILSDVIYCWIWVYFVFETVCVSCYVTSFCIYMYSVSLSVLLSLLDE